MDQPGKVQFLLVLLLGTLLIPGKLFSQDDFRRFTKADGLSANRTFEAVEDHNGFVWISTNEGIDRFDGQNFVHYELDLHDEIVGLGYHFYHLLSNQQNELIVVSKRSHVFRYNRLFDRFDRILEFEPHYGKYVHSVTLNGDYLLLGTPLELYAYNIADASFYETPVKEPIYALSVMPGGYALGANDGLKKLSEDFTNYKSIGQRAAITEDNKYRKILLDSANNRLVLGTVGRGLFFLDLNSGDYIPSSLNGQLGDYPIWDVTLANDSTMIISTDGAGVYLVHRLTGEIFRHYVFDQDDEFSLGSNVVHNSLVLANGLWFAMTDIGGINLSNPLKPKFQHISRQKGSENTLRNNVIHTINPLGDNAFVFGTDLGVAIWDRAGDHWEFIDDDSQGKNHVVTSMTVTSKGTVIYTDFLDGLHYIGAALPFRDIPQEVANCRNAKAIYFDEADNTLWTGGSSETGSLQSYELRTGRHVNYSLGEVLTIVRYKADVLLVGTLSGLYLVDPETYEAKPFEPFASAPIEVVSLLVAPNNKLWVGSSGGLFLVNLLTMEQELHIGLEEGLASEHIYSLEFDVNKNIWLSTESGISKVEPITKKVTNYYPSDGLRAGEFRLNASATSSAGEILVGGNEGIVIFDPAQINAPVIDRTLLFTALEISQETVYPQPKGVLSQSINIQEDLNLNYNQNSFALHFACIDFTHPDRVNFSWQLVGFDKEWQTAEQGVATYSNLLPGDYVLKVSLNDPALRSANLEKTINIHIAEPLWRTNWALALYFIAIIGILLLSFHYNRLIHEVNASQEKLRYIINLSHEIKTPLSLIKAPIGDLVRETDDDATKQKLGTAMANVERLQERIGRYLDFKRVNEIVTVHAEKIEAVSFVEKRIVLFKMLANSQEVELNFDPQVARLEVYCDPELLSKILNNLLSNAIKYNRPGGKVKVRLKTRHDKWQVTVADTGIGIPKKEQKKIFRLFYRASNALDSEASGSGVGLVLSRDMARVMGGKLYFTSQEGEGTRFVLRLPIGSADEYDPLPLAGEGDDLAQTSEAPGQFKLLIVEDDQELRKYIRDEIGGQYKVLLADNGQEALKIVQNDLPDLVLTDIAMPKMNGRQLCAKIKSASATSHIPVILLSGLDSREEVLAGLKAGADSYITKPFDSSILAAKIENLLRKRQEVKANILNAEATGKVELENKLDQEFLQTITKLVHDNLADSDLSVQLLLTSVGMSRTAFYHKLKLLTDLSPAEFIRVIRLNSALEMLRSGEYHVNEVAYRCGFADPKYFSTAFKRQFGQSPSTFLSSI